MQSSSFGGSHQDARVAKPIMIWLETDTASDLRDPHRGLNEHMYRVQATNSFMSAIIDDDEEPCDRIVPCDRTEEMLPPTKALPDCEGAKAATLEAQRRAVKTEALIMVIMVDAVVSRG
jgi:hypothetical protein